MFKLLKIAALIGVGYVLGAKAGRERYEQIARTASKVRQSPPVQAGVAKAGEKAPVVADAVKHKASDVAATVAEKAPFGSSSQGGAHAATDAGSNGTGS
ncbi:hypothetical protein [Nocardioides sp. JQ2195]|uniref:hypothetical protein n=1 Tax=Nocardioides sp. JQ2195 TaxID=2592334 RepID=UPI00198129B1|nr:hypothetical protein [Nocardioides sp. JQ2195]